MLGQLAWGEGRTTQGRENDKNTERETQQSSIILSTENSCQLFWSLHLLSILSNSVVYLKIAAVTLAQLSSPHYREFLSVRVSGVFQPVASHHSLVKPSLCRFLAKLYLGHHQRETNQHSYFWSPTETRTFRVRF